VLFAQALEWAPLPDGGVAVTTDYKTYHADKLVISSGAWMDQMVPELKVKRLCCAVLCCAAAAAL
jgi:glycine/D-amino acid oxidase-like deaminating enzyme